MRTADQRREPAARSVPRNAEDDEEDGGRGQDGIAIDAWNVRNEVTDASNLLSVLNCGTRSVAVVLSRQHRLHCMTSVTPGARRICRRREEPGGDSNVSIRNPSGSSTNGKDSSPPRWAEKCAVLSYSRRRFTKPARRKVHRDHWPVRSP